MLRWLHTCLAYEQERTGLQRCKEKAKDGVETNCAVYVHFVSLALIRNGSGTSSRINRRLRMLRMVIKRMAITKTEAWFYNVSMFTVGTSREFVCSDCAMRASCTGLCSIGCTSTSRSIDDTELFNSCRSLRLLL